VRQQAASVPPGGRRAVPAEERSPWPTATRRPRSPPVGWCLSGAGTRRRQRRTGYPRSGHTPEEAPGATPAPSQCSHRAGQCRPGPTGTRLPGCAAGQGRQRTPLRRRSRGSSAGKLAPRSSPTGAAPTRWPVVAPLPDMLLHRRFASGGATTLSSAYLAPAKGARSASRRQMPSPRAPTTRVACPSARPRGAHRLCGRASPSFWFPCAVRVWPWPSLSVQWCWRLVDERSTPGR